MANSAPCCLISYSLCSLGAWMEKVSKVNIDYIVFTFGQLFQLVYTPPVY